MADNNTVFSQLLKSKLPKIRKVNGNPADADIDNMLIEMDGT